MSAYPSRNATGGGAIRLVFALTILAFGVLLGPAPPALAQPAELVFVPDSWEFGCADSLVVDINIDATVTDLRGFSLVLEFDDDIIRPIRVLPGALVSGAACPFFLQWLPYTAGDDSLAVDVATLGCSVSGPGSILQVVFMGESDGYTYISCRDANTRSRLRTGLNEAIPFTLPPIVVYQWCPVATRTIDWGGLRRMYR